MYNNVLECEDMNFITVAEAAKKWSISERRIQKLCEEGRIDGAKKFSRIWVIPQNAAKPLDARRKENRNENTDG